LQSGRLTSRKEASVRIECESGLTKVPFRIFWRIENSFARAGNIAKILPTYNEITYYKESAHMLCAINPIWQSSLETALS
jgi:hypothetical protein